jgi:hypothetical protein
MQAKHFTLAEANSLVPWLESVFRAAAPLRREMTEARAEMDGLLRKAHGNGSSSHEQTLSEKRQAVQDLDHRIQEMLGQVVERGIIVRDMDRGLVDFPSFRQGREVFLCWLWGEERVAFWHETDAGFSSRQPL